MADIHCIMAPLSTLLVGGFVTPYKWVLICRLLRTFVTAGLA